MFRSIFSFEGRIRRTEFGISFIIYLIFYVGILMFTEGPNGIKILGLLFAPVLWFLWAQGAKRCHDIGKSGWWQIIPFYFFWLLFQDGDRFENEYGTNPKSPEVFNEMNYHDPIIPSEELYKPRETEEE